MALRFSRTIVKVSTERDSGKTLDVTTVTIGTPAEAPSAAFRTRAGKKPGVRVPNLTGESSYNLQSVAAWIKQEIDASREIPLYTALAFLELAAPLVSETCDEEWKSYDIVLGNKDEIVNPMSVIDRITETQVVHCKTEHSEMTDPELHLILLLLLSIPRYRFASTFNQQAYTNSVRDAITSISSRPYFDGLGSSFSAQLEAVGTISAGLDTDEYLAMVSAYDMFLTKFPKSKLAPLRVGTLITYYKDMAALLDLQRASSKTNIPIEVLFDTNLLKNCQMEFEKMYSTKEEFNQPGSYFPYTRSMSIVAKCPYSVSENPCNHAYYMTILCLEGDMRGINASVPTSAPSGPIIENAITVYSLLTQTTEFQRIYFGDDADYQSYQDVKELNAPSDLEKLTDYRDPNNLFAKLSSDYVPPKSVLQAYLQKLKNIPKRPQKVGELVCSKLLEMVSRNYPSP